MNIAVTGSSGLIGTELVRALQADGHAVRRIVRRAPNGADEVQWDPSAHSLPADALDGIEAVIHLAGVGVGDKRWSDAYKKQILDSRVDGTTTIADAIAQRGDQIKVLISASAVGWYGDRGEQVLNETDASGNGFLAEVVRQWEASTAAAASAGVRVVTIRTGVVLSPDGGALGKVLPIFKLGGGGKLGNGRQWFPWIALADEVAAIRYLLTNDALSGPVNLTAPEPVRNRDYTSAIRRALHRPTLATVPRIALKVALGDFADEGVLVSQRVIPRKLLDSGFRFAYPDLGDALRAIL